MFIKGYYWVCKFTIILTWILPILKINFDCCFLKMFTLAGIHIQNVKHFWNTYKSNCFRYRFCDIHVSHMICPLENHTILHIQCTCQLTPTFHRPFSIGVPAVPTTAHNVSSARNTENVIHVPGAYLTNETIREMSKRIKTNFFGSIAAIWVVPSMYV